MLVAFTVENFRSIRAQQTLSLEEPRTDEHLQVSNVADRDGRRLLKSVALYGANASGKSNILRAVGWLRDFILHSVTRGQVGEPIDVAPFLLSTETEHAPSHFEIEFLLNGFLFRYGARVSREAVLEEWLFRKRPKSKAARLFTRDGQSIDVSEDHFKDGRALTEHTRPNALFLSVCAQFNEETSVGIVTWMRNMVVLAGSDDRKARWELHDLLAKADVQRDLLQTAKLADFGIIDLARSESNDGDATALLQSGLRVQMPRLLRDPAVLTSHAKRNQAGEPEGDVAFELFRDESAGTQKFVLLAAPLLQALQRGSVVVVDEFDARLHPRLTQAVLDLFHSPANRNGAQLICAAHDVTLLEPERFRRDQIWFCEKDDAGATDLYSLADYDPKDVRPDARFSRRYLQGVFGAVPRLADFVGKVAESLRHE